MTATVQTAPSGQTTSGPCPISTTRRRDQRAVAVGLSALATSAVWAVADLSGADFRLSDAQGSVVIGLPIVVGFSLFCARLGWAALAVLERFARRAVAVWTGLAIAVLLLSIVPTFLEHATDGTRSALVVIHVTVAAVLIPLLRRSAGRV
ncbi:MAG: DUF6069 family protein [Actinomycetota bacterium]|nr:DUF6069 family protein [Actinomycetota bacterium]MDQ2956434.1 DUF6069 family protein [Actinomycetota bacterium]